MMVLGSKISPQNCQLHSEYWNNSSRYFAFPPEVGLFLLYCGQQLNMHLSVPVGLWNETINWVAKMWPEMKDPKLLLEVAMPLLASLNIARQELYCGITSNFLLFSVHLKK